MKYVWFGNGTWSKMGATHILAGYRKDSFGVTKYTQTLCGAFNDMFEWAPEQNDIPTYLCKRCEKIARKEGLT